MTTDRASLRLELEATTAKFEAAMKRALREGTITATELDRRFNKAFTMMSRQADKSAKGLQSVVNMSGSGRFVLQNTANQIGDIAVQMSSGTTASRALSQQLPQLLGGFGALGGVLGIVGPLLGTLAAIGLPLAAVFFSMGSNAEEAADKVRSFEEKLSSANAALGRAREAMALVSQGAAQDLAAIYGEVTEKVLNLADALAEIEKRAVLLEASEILGDSVKELPNQLASMGQGIGEVVGQMEDLRQAEADLSLVDPDDELALAAMQENLSLLRQQIEALPPLKNGMRPDETVEAIRTLVDMFEKARGAQDDLGQANALQAIRNLLIDIGIDMQEFNDKTVKAEDLLRQVSFALADATGNANAAAAAVGGIDAAARSAADSASVLARNLGIAIGRARALTRAGQVNENTVQGFEANDPRNPNVSSVQREFERVQNDFGTTSIFDPSRADELRGTSTGSRSGGGGSGGGGRSSVNDAQDIVDRAQRDIEALQLQIDLIGKTGREVAELRAKQRLLNEAKRKGLDIDKVQTKTGETLREEIKRQAEEIGNLTAQYEEAKAKADFFKQSQDTLTDGLIDAIVEGKNLGGVLEDLAKQFAKAALQAALFNTGPLSSGSSGGGLLGGVIAPVVGGLLGAAGSTSAPSTAKIPSVATPSTSALKKVRQPTQIDVHVMQGELFEPVVRDISNDENTKVNVVRDREQARRLPGQVNAIISRKDYRRR